MNWKSVAGKVIDAGLETIGGALYGSIGSFIGDKVGDMIAAALGVEATPEAVEKKLDTMTPDQINDTLAPVQVEANAKWPALAEMVKANAADRTAQAQAINETIRKEIGKVSWWHWRHIGGYVVLWISLIVSAGFIKAIFWGVPSAQDLAALIGAITPIFVALCALNGYIAQDTSGLKSIAAVGTKPEGVVTTVAKTIAGTKKK